MTNYKHIDVSASLKIEKPHKINGVYQSNTLFKVQTPEVTIDLDNNSISFRMIKKGKFVTLLEELENNIVSILYNNSTDFFNGKTFTLNKIRESLEKLFKLDNEGIVTLNNVTIPSDVKVYDHFNELLTVSKGTGKVTGVCILQLNSIKFIKSVINVGFTLTHLKLSVEKKKFTECILEDEETYKKEEKEDKEYEEDIEVSYSEAISEPEYSDFFEEE